MSGAVRVDRLLPHAKPREDVRRHVQRMRHVGRDLGVADRSVQPRRGELWRVVAVDQVMYDAGVVRLLLPDLVEDLGRLFLVGKGLVGRSALAFSANA